MLPPGNLIGFGRLRRGICRLTGGRKFAVGNSSVMAFHGALGGKLCTELREEMTRQAGPARVRRSDDSFISWFAQPWLRPVPTSLGVMFRREFLSRNALVAWVREQSPCTRRRRAGLVAVTFNGTEHKPELLARLPEGVRPRDRRGRKGRWSAAAIGPLKQIIETEWPEA